ncbi:MAG: AraC family transcriptional regulator [Alphaproteobacteria bacterium]|nr:MAG: AraC family transcriptional regulator [Alphaproteobacteria bacterium]
MDKHLADIRLIETTSAPAFLMARDYADGEVVPSHSHSVGQLLQATSGVIRARTPGRAWAVPPGRALWIPADTGHGFWMNGEVRLRTLFVHPRSETPMPDGPVLIKVSPLMRELILRGLEIVGTVQEPVLWPLVSALLLKELLLAPRDCLSLPWPKSDVLLKFAALVEGMPEDRRPLQALASELGIGAKTLSRRFLSETGLTPDAWRRQARLLAAVSWLETGVPVTSVAYDLGYASVGAFSKAYRDAFGVLPGKVRVRRGR